MQRRVQTERQSAVDSGPGHHGTQTLAIGRGTPSPLCGGGIRLQDSGVCGITQKCPRPYRVFDMIVQFAFHIERIGSLTERCNGNRNRYSEDNNDPDFAAYPS